jgi:hypothetical protein
MKKGKATAAQKERFNKLQDQSATLNDEQKAYHDEMGKVGK